jgi:hypothetical protein
MMEATPVQFRLKGSRTYIHGTDMYAVFVANVFAHYAPDEQGSLRMTIHRIATRQSSILVSAPGADVARPADVYAEFSGQTPDGIKRAYLVESGGPVTKRYSYDEERIENLCVLSEQTITIAGDSGYAPIEVVVAMNKRLHNSLFPLTSERWMFTRFETNRPLQPDDAQRFRVSFLQKLGTKLSRSAILVAEQPIGHVYFSAVPK